MGPTGIVESDPGKVTTTSDIMMTLLKGQIKFFFFNQITNMAMG